MPTEKPASIMRLPLLLWGCCGVLVALGGCVKHEASLATVLPSAVPMVALPCVPPELHARLDQATLLYAEPIAVPRGLAVAVILADTHGHVIALYYAGQELMAIDPAPDDPAVAAWLRLAVPDCQWQKASDGHRSVAQRRG